MFFVCLFWVNLDMRIIYFPRSRIPLLILLHGHQTMYFCFFSLLVSSAWQRRALLAAPLYCVSNLGAPSQMKGCDIALLFYYTVTSSTLLLCSSCSREKDWVIQE